jgi:hypothetical protein
VQFSSDVLWQNWDFSTRHNHVLSYSACDCWIGDCWKIISTLNLSYSTEFTLQHGQQTIPDCENNYIQQSHSGWVKLLTEMLFSDQYHECIKAITEQVSLTCRVIPLLSLKLEVHVSLNMAFSLYIHDHKVQPEKSRTPCFHACSFTAPVTILFTWDESILFGDNILRKLTADLELPKKYGWQEDVMIENNTGWFINLLTTYGEFSMLPKVLQKWSFLLNRTMHPIIIIIYSERVHL